MVKDLSATRPILPLREFHLDVEAYWEVLISVFIHIKVSWWRVCDKLLIDFIDSCFIDNGNYLGEGNAEYFLQGRWECNCEIRRVLFKTYLFE